ASASFTAPTLTAPEQLTFSLTVTDNEGETATDRVFVTVNPINSAPSASAGDDQTVDEQSTVVLASNSVDSDGSINTFQWTQTAGNTVSLLDANSAQASFVAPTLTTSQDLTFSLSIIDNEGATATDSVIVTVVPVNASPVIYAGADQSVNEQTTVTLSGSATDTDGTISSVAWTQISGESVTLNNADTTTATFDMPATSGIYTFEFSATDNEGGVATDTVNINNSEYKLVHDQGSTDQFEADTVVTFTVDGYESGVQTLSWSHTSDIELTLSTSSTVTFPESVAISSLPVATDKTVTIKVAVTLDDVVVNLEKTVTMLARNPMGFESVSVAKDIITINDNYQRLTSEDLTGDGYPELLVVQDGVTKMLVNKGVNKSAASSDQYYSAITIEQNIVGYQLVDMNQDGLKDIVYGSRSLKWLANATDDSRFTVEHTISTPSNMEYFKVQMGDLDNDGDVDVAVAFSDADNDNLIGLAWIEQTAQGVWGTAVVLDAELEGYTKSLPWLSVADFDGDKVNDIVFASTGPYDYRTIWMFINDGTGTSFTKNTASALDGGGPYSSYSTRGFFHQDINQDGLMDLVTWQSGYFMYNSSAFSKAYINQGNGRFVSGYLSTQGAASMKVISADVDGDGAQDMVHGIDENSFSCDIGASCHSYRPGAIMWQENVDGTMSSTLKRLVYSKSAFAIEVDDIDNDGDLDLINGNITNGVLDLYINNTNPK
ncbi:MAG: VCBS repeat-containing protein, partial [Algicola sp.]|nr:VCBS repeat-containing protein [Algicola sp.]